MTTLYGIKNCDTVKKARKWLEENGQDFTFHDVRVDGLDISMIERWIAALGWEAVLNKRSTTWKQLDDSSKSDLNETKAAALLLANPTLIKRPVLEAQSGKKNTHIHVGFKADMYQNIFS